MLGTFLLGAEVIGMADGKDKEKVPVTEVLEEDDEFEYYDEDIEYYDDEDDGSESYDEDEDPRPPTRTKNNRWGRDAGGKAS